MDKSIVISLVGRIANIFARMYDPTRRLFWCFCKSYAEFWMSLNRKRNSIFTIDQAGVVSDGSEALPKNNWILAG